MSGKGGNKSEGAGIMGANAHVIRIESREEADRFLREIGCDDTGRKLMLPKSVFRAVKLHQLDSRGCNILKQEMLAVGGEAAVTRGVINYSEKYSDVLILGTAKQYRKLIQKLKMQPFGLPVVAEELQQVLNSYPTQGEKILRCGQKELFLGKRTLVMGVLNITLDSFSDGGKFYEPEQAVDHALAMVEEGADIIDIGAESTRPRTTVDKGTKASGLQAVDVDEELRRLMPVLEKLSGKLPVPISVDTYKARVAHEAIAAGAELINDVWGFKADSQLPGVLSQNPGIPVIVMHNQEGNQYNDLLGDVLASLRWSIQIGLDAGLAPERFILDPGIGFAKDTEQNLQLMNRLDEFRSLGFPILLGTSRKSLIGNTLGLPVDQRIEGTAATVALGIVRGVDIVRVHDVQAMKRVCIMMDAMVR